jgi:cellobiose-specific phosphotransferase system component IIB
MNCFICCNEDEEEEKPIYNNIVPYEINGIVKKIIDYNTVLVNYKVGPNEYNYIITLYNVFLYKDKHKYAEEELTKIVLNNKVSIRNIKKVDYDKMEADIFVGTMNINDWLIYKSLSIETSKKSYSLLL